jgi:YidC/Oxa1 family membrane protein insertase
MGQDGLAGGTLAALARLTPYVTVVVAAFVPLAAGLYLLTTTAWTLAERIGLRRLTRSGPEPSAGASTLRP